MLQIRCLQSDFDWVTLENSKCLLSEHLSLKTMFNAGMTFKKGRPLEY